MSLEKVPMHPIVIEYINTDESLLTIVEKHYDKNEYLETIFFKLVKSTEADFFEEQLFLDLDQAILKGHPDTNVYLLFISEAIKTACVLSQLERANVIQSIGASISQEKIHSLVKSFFFQAKAIIKFYERNLAECNRLSKESLEISDKTSLRYPRFLINAGVILASQGRLADLNKEDYDLVYLRFPRHSVSFKLTNSTYTGNYQEGFELLEECKKLFSSKYTRSVKFEGELLEILSGNFDEKKYSEKLTKSYVKVLYFLSLGNLEEALKYTQMLQKFDRVGFFVFPFEEYLPLNIELCFKNIGRSKLLLQEIIEKRGHHYLEDFFIARLQLLEKNIDGAYETFRRLIDNVKRYGALHRLIFETQFAKELKTVDLMYLMSGVNGEKFLETTSLLKKQAIKSFKLEKGVQLLIGDSLQIDEVKKLVVKFAKLKEPVLIVGETGTGKELVSRAIHEEGLNPNEPFLAINCGALTENLLQSELFGYVAGAFTGAQKEKKGIFEAAGKGTVFLDEFGDISSQLQVSLLRVLESNEIRLIGGTSNRQIECKIVIATNVDLHQAVKDKKFREDLYFRLARFDIKLPPLRERPNDIPKLIEYFLEDKSNANKSQKTLAPILMETLIAYRWPGNIRELKNEMERLKILYAEKDIIELKDFDFTHLQGTAPDISIFENKPLEKKSVASILNKPSNVLDERIVNIMNRGSKINQRLEFLKELFLQYKKLTRIQVIEIMHVSPVTASKDLENLCQTGFIVKKMPTKSVNSFYFVLNE